uniref:TIR domain-containing protein n=1 Tax=Glycine max TaxID=3847 RepID=C6TMB2_SOYBN|nr:unknown [Glycine max]
MTNEPNNKYDVFLCLVGPDTRYTFAGNLYNALRRNRINTFFTEDNHHDELLLMNGDQISPFALRAIKESNLLIVVLSPNYASSPRNLDEFVAIVRCIKRKKQLLLPVFYKVERGEIMDAIFSGPDQQALCVFEERFGDYKERVNEWKDALLEVYGWTAMEYQNGSGYEYEFIREIVDIAKRRQRRRYDVFLSFRGRDTRHSFTGFLYKAFCREGFYVFMDDEGLEGGNQISPTIMGAIERSRLSIVVFSENYGYSTWCLDELSKIIECVKTRNQVVWPIFYNVEKSDVCNQTKSYGDAMTAQEKRFGKDSGKVHKWRSALSEIANLEGEHLRENQYQYEFIERIVEKAINIPSPCSNDSYEEESRVSKCTHWEIGSCVVS